jgi:hypothetical protein
MRLRRTTEPIKTSRARQRAEDAQRETMLAALRAIFGVASPVSPAPPRPGDQIWGGQWMSPAEIRQAIRDTVEDDGRQYDEHGSERAEGDRRARDEDERTFADQRRAEEEDDE